MQGGKAENAVKSVLVLQSAFFIVFACGCTTFKESFTLSFDAPTATAFWVERDPPTEPLNAAEALAVQSAAGLMTLQRIKGSAYYEGEEDYFSIIRHEQRSAGGETYVISVRYRIRDGLVYGETVPHIVAVLDPKKEEFARGVAFSVINGTPFIIPVIYEGRVFVPGKGPMYGDQCIIDVVEKDLEREYATYRIRTC